MNKARINGTEIAYEVRGEGETVLLLHCSFVARAFNGMMREPALGDYALINYHRRGYGERAPAQTPFGIEQQAEDALVLLSSLGVGRAHLVGHSYGANIAIQTALAAPDRVASLTLIEPPLPFFMSPQSLNFMLPIMGEAVGRYMSGDAAGAVELWLNGAFGPGFRDITDRALPGSWAEMVRDGQTAITVEAPTLQTWAVGPNDLRRITAPVLSVFHADAAAALFQEVHEGLAKVLPNVEALVIPNVTHLMQIADPRSVAEGVAGFLARHPIGSPVPVTSQ